MLTAPGIEDGNSGRTIEQAGFKVIYSDLAVIAKMARFTMSEMSENAGQIVASARTAGPRSAMRTSDMGTGSTWSGPSASTRDTQFAELHIEDQGFPAKRGHLDWRASLHFDSPEASVLNLS